MFKHITFILFFCVFLFSRSFSQNDSTGNTVKYNALSEVKMQDGSVYLGHIEKQSDSLIYLKSSGGVLILIPKNNVAAIDLIKGYVKQDTAGSHVHAPGVYNYYYMTTSNAFLFNKGEVYGGFNYFSLFSVNYALSRNFSLGIATSVIGIPMGIHAKANFELSHKLYLGLEAVAGSLMYVGPKTWGTGGTAKLTFGDEHKNLTLYAGYFDAEYWVQPVRRKAKNGRPPLFRPGNYYISITSPFAGMAYSARLSTRTQFVCDVFAFPGIQIYTGSIGVRGNSKQKISWAGGWQFIVNKVPSVNRTYPVPYFGFSYRL